jgi:predicted transcriptional regulator YheO
MKMSPDGSHLYFMDNTMAFFLDPAGNDKTRPALQRTQRFSRHLYQALDRVTVATLEQELAAEKDSPYEILTPLEMRAVVARRDAVKKHIDGLVALYGEPNVLVFP